MSSIAVPTAAMAHCKNASTLTGPTRAVLPTPEHSGHPGALLEGTPAHAALLNDVRRRELPGKWMGGCGARSSPDCSGEWVAVPCLGDRKSTRLNSSHPSISYAVFC